MALGIVYSSRDGEVRRALQGLAEPVNAALVAAMREAGDLIQKRGRGNIRSAGFTSRRWTEGLQVQVTPRDGFNASLRVFHRVGFAGIFEEGGTIRGKPLLWVPIERNLPAARSGWTPRRFVRLVGPLRSARSSSRPLLVGKPPGFARPVPVFAGVSSITIRKRFDIAGIVEQVGDQFEALYEKNLRDVA